MSGDYSGRTSFGQEHVHEQLNEHDHVLTSDPYFHDSAREVAARL